jgi:hypothetical protein
VTKISALLRVKRGVFLDKILSSGFKAGLILLGMNAVGWAKLDAERILDAGVGNYVRMVSQSAK